MKVEFRNNNITFKQGLSSKILQAEKLINVEKQAKLFAENYGVEVEFLNNKSATLANCYCLKILLELATKFNTMISLPPAVFLYKENNLIDNSMSDNFCISDTQDVLKNEYPFAGRSIFFKDFYNLKEIDIKSEILYSKKISSSPHFLAPFIHEWLHSLQLHSIYDKYGYGGDCEYLKKMYPDKGKGIKGVELIKELETKNLTPEENEIIFDNLGEYATKPENQYLEVFSETITQLICSSLKGTEIVKSPLDLLKNKNAEFKKIIEKVCNI